MRQRETGVDAKRRERGACEREPYRIGQPQPARRKRDQDRKAEQSKGSDEQDVHGRLFSGASQSEKPGPCYAASLDLAPARMERWRSIGNGARLHLTGRAYS